MSLIVAYRISEAEYPESLTSYSWKGVSSAGGITEQGEEGEFINSSTSER